MLVVLFLFEGAHTETVDCLAPVGGAGFGMKWRRESLKEINPPTPFSHLPGGSMRAQNKFACRKTPLT